jgi:type IV secretory pathway VirB9-like protein
MRSPFHVVAVIPLLLAQVPLLAQERGADAADTHSQPARLVTYTPGQVVALRAKVHGLTIIRLPEGETIVDVVCPDKDLWIINGHDRDIYVKPTQVGSHTDLGILTASDTLYAFVLQEVSNVAGAERDFLVNVAADEAPSGGSQARPVQKFVPATQVQQYREEAEAARQETQRAKEQAETKLNAALAEHRATYPLSLHFGYRFPANVKPFLVRAIFDDGTFTYIQTAAREAPALYEIRDNAPALIQFDLRNGTYIVHKVLDRGFLAVGKQRLYFVREED